MKPVHIIQASALDAFLWICAALPPKMASRLGGEVLGVVGPLLKSANTRVDKHLHLAFPEKTDQERKAIAKGMWKHLGMLLAEYPHLGKFLDGDASVTVEARGLEHLEGLEDKPIAFVSAHVGNWEVLPLMAAKNGLAFHPVFRPPNNPLVAKKLEELRRLNGKLPEAFPKSSAGLKKIAETLKRGGRMGFLVDQRHSRGPLIDFFGHPAQITTISMDMALKYGAVIVPGRIIRRGPCDFIFEVCAPMLVENRDAMDLMGELYGLFEEWICEAPEQWLWMHRRWGKNV